MKVEHQFEMNARCPADGTRDVYTVTVRLTRLVKVEELLAVAAGYADRQEFQETITEQLAAAFGAEVETVGVHSRVRTRVTAGVPA